MSDSNKKKDFDAENVSGDIIIYNNGGEVTDGSITMVLKTASITPGTVNIFFTFQSLFDVKYVHDTLGKLLDELEG